MAVYYGWLAVFLSLAVAALLYFQYEVLVGYARSAELVVNIPGFVLRTVVLVFLSLSIGVAFGFSWYWLGWVLVILTGCYIFNPVSTDITVKGRQGGNWNV